MKRIRVRGYQLFCGIDPGVSGAIAVVSRLGELVRVERVPIMPSARPGRNEVDFERMQELAFDLGLKETNSFVVIEDVWGVYSQSRPSAYSFGHATGRIKAAVEYLPHTEVPPGVWKKHFRLTKTKKGKANKQASVRVAQKLYPQLRRREKFDHNEAEAILLARYCWEVYR